MQHMIISCYKGNGERRKKTATVSCNGLHAALESMMYSLGVDLKEEKRTREKKAGSKDVQQVEIMINRNSDHLIIRHDDDVSDALLNLSDSSLFFSSDE